MNDPFNPTRQPAQRPSGVTTAVINGMTCGFHMPPATQSRHGADGDELEQGLPPSAIRPMYLVDDFDAACPADWQRSGPTSGSYFVATKAGYGMWLDFTRNAQHTHDVAVLVSVQGVNPLTGLKVEDKYLQQYREQCPKHKEPFGHERMCKSCGFAWPAQNYIATTTGAPLWLDGFRAEDGTVRQWKLTENVSEGVAANIIGDKRVFAIGVVFYESKLPKPKPAYQTRGGYHPEAFLGGDSPHTYGNLEGIAPATRGMRSASPVRAKSFDVAAGARIKQSVGIDRNDPSYWSETPSGVIFINYVDDVTVDEILARGTTPQNREGFLAGMPVGHGGGNG